ncbi:hypothetical protein HRbin08_00355 [bacterium HR08]|nr:hypothetical protein HRbin08_00355 [bacterium HR08]
MERVKVEKAILGGFIATLVMTMIMYLAPMMGMPKMDVAAMLGGMMSQTMPEPMSGLWLLGMMLHFVNGSVIFPLIFAFLLYSRLPGAPWRRGLIWGLILWFLSQAMVMPMMGAGFFSSHAPQPVMTVVGSLMGHIIYGAILAQMYGREPTAKLQTS